MNALARLRRDERGATAIEFAFVAPLLFFALASLVEIGVLGMMAANLDNAVVEAARRLRTGQDAGATSSDTFETQICQQMGGNFAACRDRMTIGVERFSRFADANALVSQQPGGQFDKGAPGDIVVVKVNYRWPLMTPFLATAYGRDGPMSVTLGSRVAFKNEPYQ
jgi:Flp pilus assembly protein TadG